MGQRYDEGTRGLNTSQEHIDLVAGLQARQAEEAAAAENARAARIQAMEELGGPAGVVTDQAALAQRTAEILASQQAAQEQQTPPPAAA